MTDLAIPSAPAASAAVLPPEPPQRMSGWTPDRQRDFLMAISEGHTVEVACRIVGLSVASAYAFRRRASGAAFAIGWQAACLHAREKLADVLLSRAIDGQVETITRPNGDVIERHRYDNRLATAMLTRMDRLAESGGEATHHAARLVAQEWDQFLDLIGRDGGPARAGLFLGLRVADAGDGPAADLAPVVALARADRWLRSGGGQAGGGQAGEVDVRDLDVLARTSWTGEQWARAEAAGLVHIAPPEPPVEESNGNPQLPQPGADGDGEDGAWREPDRGPVWLCPDRLDWRTHYPPPPGFTGHEDGEYGDEGYERDLTLQEEDMWCAMREAAVAGQRAAESVDRDNFFGFVPVAAGDTGDPATAEDIEDEPETEEDVRFREQSQANDAMIERLRRLAGLCDADDAFQRGEGPDPLGLEPMPPKAAGRGPAVRALG